MNHPGTSSAPGRGARPIFFNSATIALLVLLNSALAASAPRKEGGSVAYTYGVYLEQPPPCPGEERNVILSAFGMVLHEESGMVVDSWPIPGVEIVISEPKLGVFTTKETMAPGLNGSTMVTSETGIAYARYKAKETGKESLQVQFTGYDYRTNHSVEKKASLSFRVWDCLLAPIINSFAKADLPEGNNITVWGVGGGEARINDDGQITGEGEINMTEAITLPEQCTPVESSGQAPFTISGNLTEETINLQFDFSDLTIPPATSTCTAGGVSIPVQVLGGNSGDPGVAMGFHELSTAAGGGTTSFPYPVAEYSGGTTVVITLIREETAASIFFNPFAAIGAQPIWSWR